MPATNLAGPWVRGVGGRHITSREGRIDMASTTEAGEQTGTKDKDYNLIWFTEACLSNALRLES